MKMIKNVTLVIEGEDLFIILDNETDQNSVLRPMRQSHILIKEVFDHVKYFCEIHKDFIDKNRQRWYEDNHRDRFVNQIVNTVGWSRIEVSTALSALGL